MAVSVESFRQMFPVYRKTDQETIQAKLVVARLSVNPSIWGDKTDAGVLYLTAHYLALNPSGQNAKLEPPEMGITPYGETFKRLQRQVTYGLRVAGLPTGRPPYEGWPYNG